jgi:hypothetical protein
MERLVFLNPSSFDLWRFIELNDGANKEQSTM